MYYDYEREAALKLADEIGVAKAAKELLISQESIFLWRRQKRAKEAAEAAEAAERANKGKK